MTYSKVIAIDGPSGSGKSTLAKKLAGDLGILYIDTGAMFRAISCALSDDQIDFDDHQKVEEFLAQMKMEYAPTKGVLIVVNGVDMTERIREHIVSKWASIVSQIPVVRDFLLNFQRDLGSKRLCVMEGRDIGTVIFPQAFCKIFFTASAKVRAMRRQAQLLEKTGEEVALEKVLKDVVKRDESDMNREIAPLKQAEDAIYLDTTDMPETDVLAKLNQIAKEQASKVGQAL